MLSGITATRKQRIIVGGLTFAELTKAYLYGSHIGEGSLTQYIANVFQSDVEKLVISFSHS